MSATAQNPWKYDCFNDDAGHCPCIVFLMDFIILVMLFFSQFEKLPISYQEIQKFIFYFNLDTIFMEKDPINHILANIEFF